MAAGPTKLQNLINPEVIGAYLDVKLVDKIKLTPVVEVDRTLEGRPGNTLSLPAWTYIGDAADLAEGGTLNFENITESMVDVTVKKVAKGISITDEAVLSGHGNPVEQIGQQLLVSVASKVEADLYAAVAAASTKKVVDAGGFTKECIVDMRAQYGEDIEDAMYLFVNPVEYATLCKDPDFVQIANGAKVLSGEVGTLYGVRIVVANRVKAGEPFMMKPGALALIMKRNVMVEADRDINTFSTKYAVSDHYVAYVKYADRIVKFATA
ncbi:MAG: N4-gp56 family major capsid protein [Romboutsia timonensis]